MARGTMHLYCTGSDVAMLNYIRLDMVGLKVGMTLLCSKFYQLCYSALPKIQPSYAFEMTHYAHKIIM